MSGAHIGGQFNCTQAVFTKPDRTTLTADQLTVDGSMVLEKVRCIGELRMLNAHIGGQLNFSQAVLSNPNGRALSADGVTVDAGMFLDEVRCTGQLWLVAAHITGLLDFREAILLMLLPKARERLATQAASVGPR
jgi:hypothetical protein